MGRALTLLAERHPLAPPEAQRARLAALPLARSFDDAAGELRALPVEVLQLNVGKLCNQTCRHCHVDAGPDREEVMRDDVVDAALAVVERERIPIVDVTGGAPELHPRFEEIVARARAAGARVLDRCNLTVLTTPRFAHLPAFFAAHDVEVVCSLPSWEAERTDAQRGEGVFDKSLEALRALNAVGYGQPGSGKKLVVVSNPAGAFLPPPQGAFERDFCRELEKRGVVVSDVLVLANMPIARFLEWLDRTGNTQRYVDKLVGAFNPAAVPAVMCRTMVSVGWDGRLWDCDFNQMLEVPVEAAAPTTIFAWDGRALARRRIATGAHCFGCTAGQGSSCGGALT
jgi:radical SAM/Cys-rich protein